MYRAFTLFLVVALFIFLLPTDLDRPAVPVAFNGYVGPTENTARYLFLGDLMLARYVETLIEERGTSYLYENITPLTPHYNAVIANFEATIPEQHTPTPTSSLQFSVASSSLSGLAEIVTHVSLANNHTNDFGSETFTNTQTTLRDLGIDTFGHHSSISTSSVVVVDDTQSVSLLGVHMVGALASSSVAAVVSELATRSGIQIVYVHWGEEYERDHSDEQRRVAEQLIDAGADAIIGHHPHVVQNIEWYNGAPIFYSLGNFVFDQYFSQDVQTHLALELSVIEHELFFRLIPLTSLDSPSAPRLMNVDERRAFLDDLADRSDPHLRTEIVRGRLSVPVLLASS